MKFVTSTITLLIDVLRRTKFFENLPFAISTTNIGGGHTINVSPRTLLDRIFVDRDHGMLFTLVCRLVYNASCLRMDDSGSGCSAFHCVHITACASLELSPY